MFLKLAIAVICVMANAFFVAAEFALVRVRTTQLETSAQKGEKRAERALQISRKLDAYLSATQLGITLASLGLGWLGEPTVAVLLAPILSLCMASEAVVHAVSLAVAFTVITVIHIVIGELAPKSLAIQRAEWVALRVALPMRVFFAVTYPFLAVLNKLSNLTLKLFGIPPVTHEDGSLSAEEIRLVVAGGQIDNRKRELMARVLQGTDRPVRAIMVPRVDMEWISLLDTPSEIIHSLRTNGFSRVPLMEANDPDKVVGYVYLKDIFVGDGLPTGGIRALRRDILFVPESRTVGDVLEDFKRTHIPIAIVVDEYGGTSGLVTMEDILEEIVGELQDELDVEAPRINRREDGSMIVEGGLPVAELESVGIVIDPIEGHEIVAGHIVSQLGRLARPGDIVELGSYDATVEDVRNRRITRVRLVPRIDEPKSGKNPT
ncbi:MAG: hemolysin family protein, partial [Polyangiaceae bacterium]|nr:hemolysin family protein [Polyangiaceae bacterium]